MTQGGVDMTTATATDVQNNFGKFLKMAQAGEEIVIFKNGSEVARLVSGEKRQPSYLMALLVFFHQR